MNEWDIQFGLTHDCIRACVYSNFIYQKKITSGAWPSIHDMCYSDAVMTWNQIFGQRSQDTHWSKFVAKIALAENLNFEYFSKEYLMSSLCISDSEWESYHKVMVRTRNTRLAHYNCSDSFSDLANITLAFRSSCLYRDWLIYALRGIKSSGVDIKITKTTTEDIIKNCLNDIESAVYLGL